MQKSAILLRVDLFYAFLRSPQYSWSSRKMDTFSFPLSIASPASLPILHLQVYNRGPKASSYQPLQPQPKLQPCGIHAITPAKTLAMSNSSRNSSTSRKPQGTRDTWHMKFVSFSSFLLKFLVRLILTQECIVSWLRSLLRSSVPNQNSGHFRHRSVSTN